MNTFTQEQVAQFYQAITAQDESFVIMMAKAAINSSADIQCDMWADRESGTAVPDESDVRNMAEQFTTDMVADFMTSFVSSVKSIEFDLRLQLKHHVMATFK